VSTRGSEEWARASARLLEKLMRAAERATNEGMNIIERAEKANLRRFTHPLGTPTTSPPGEPPALVTGNLRRSWKTIPATRIGAYRVRARGGPTAVQSRIQELGGRTGRHHRTTLPRRPYLRPAVDSSRRDVHDVYRRRFEAVILATR